MKAIAAVLGILFNNTSNPEQARSALARARAWRRGLLWVLAAGVPLAIVAIARGWWTPNGPGVMFAPAGVSVLLVLLREAEGRHLAVSIADQPVPDVSTMTMTWRFSLAARRGLTVAVVALIIAYLVMSWARFPILYFDAPTTLLYAWLIYDGLVRTAWRPLTRTAHVADIDAAGLHVFPLGLSVPWNQVTGIFLKAEAVRWVLADPKALVEALPIRAGRRRALRRWLRRHGGGIEITGWQMRETPATVFAVSHRLWTRSTQPGPTPGSGEM